MKKPLPNFVTLSEIKRTLFLCQEKMPHYKALCNVFNVPKDIEDAIYELDDLMHIAVSILNNKPHTKYVEKGLIMDINESHIIALIAAILPAPDKWKIDLEIQQDKNKDPYNDKNMRRSKQQIINTLRIKAAEALLLTANGG
jgi:hypothetical protein